MHTISAIKFEKFKEIIHPILIKGMSGKTTGELVVDGEMPENGNYLIVANHYCIEDIPTLGQAIKKHFYLLVSDEDKNTIDGLGLELNGTQWVKRLDKSSRELAYGNIVEILKRGKNFAIYPEATWNLSPNQLMAPLNFGCIKISLESGVPIIPVVTHFTREKRYTMIGVPFTPTSDLIESVKNLRDIMATMIWQLIKKSYIEHQCEENNNMMKIEGEEYYYSKRSDIKSNDWDNNIKDRYSKYKRASLDMAGVREFESQFIFTPNTDDYQFFQVFNSRIITDENGNIIVQRVSSENNGYNANSFGEEDHKGSFGFGYNEKVLKKEMNK